MAGGGGGGKRLRACTHITSAKHEVSKNDLRPGSRARLRTLEALGDLMLSFAI